MDANVALVSVRCIGLKIHSKAFFSNVGLLTNLYVRATSGTAANAKNEKRFIKIYQSKAFRVGGRSECVISYCFKEMFYKIFFR